MKFSAKLKLIRNKHGLTQAEFAESIGISRGYLSGLEIGKVSPTPILINCVSLTYHIDKDWLLDDNNEDLSGLNGSDKMVAIIMDKYQQLNGDYKIFVEKQILDLLEIQNKARS